MNQVFWGLRALRKHQILRNLQTEKGQLDPDDPSRKVKCMVPVHIMYTLKKAVPARNPNQFSRTARESDYWLLAAESVECLDGIK